MIPIRLLMFIFQIFILIFSLKCNQIRFDSSESTEWQCTNDIDKALLKISLFNHKNDDNILIDYQYLDCISCSLINLAKLNRTNEHSINLFMDSYYSYKFKVYHASGDIICDTFHYDSLKECGIFSFKIDLNTKSCKFELIKSLSNYRYDLYIYLALVAAFIFIFATNLVEKSVKIYRENHKIDSVADSNQIELNKINNSNENQKDDKKSVRLNSLDTFRGLSLAIVRKFF
jgi:hypothetical protein